MEEVYVVKRVKKYLKIKEHIHSLLYTRRQYIYREHQNIWVCDICRRNVQEICFTGEQRNKNLLYFNPYHCFECDYDACYNCALNIPIYKIERG